MRDVMTPTLTELLAQKRQLLERLIQEPCLDLDQQDEIERRLANINDMLNRLDEQLIKAPATRHQREWAKQIATPGDQRAGLPSALEGKGAAGERRGQARNWVME
jgi:hypothetical protein